MLVERELEVERWFVKEPFDPGSSDQVRAYMQHKGIRTRPGKKAKTDKPSTSAANLEILAAKDTFFRRVLDFREVATLDSMFASGVLPHLDDEGRAHSEFGHHPRTWRLSSRGPNLENLPDDDDPDSPALRFRRCAVAEPGCVLVEADFSGIEAVLTGWFAGDEDYMRLATMGVHAWLTSHKLGCPPDLSWPDDELAAYLSKIKKENQHKPVYRGMKKTVHTTNYGGSAYQLHQASADLFPTLKIATQYQEFYIDRCPKLRDWWAGLRKRAAAENCLGGPDHPYGLRHWFWDVVKPSTSPKRQWDPGVDWNKLLAFYPQSTTAFILFDTLLALSQRSSPYFVGDLWHGSTPLRVPVHDSILAEVPETKLDVYLENLKAVMTRPIPNLGGLRFGVEVKSGPNWADMEPIASWPAPSRQAIVKETHA